MPYLDQENKIKRVRLHSGQKSSDEIINFNPEWTIFNAPGFMSDAKTDGTRHHNFAILNFTKSQVNIDEENGFIWFATELGVS